VRDAHLRGPLRHAPRSSLTLKIEFIPSRLPQLLRAREQNGCELECSLRCRIAAICLDSAQQRTNVARIGQGWIVAFAYRGKFVARVAAIGEGLRRIRWQTLSANGVLKKSIQAM
jgi:hypothetical protein